MPVDYDKGVMEYDNIKNIWDTVVSFPNCPSEDLNENGILNAGEDTNGSGNLEPGNLVVISPPSVTTDANGFAEFTIQYGKQYAKWSRVKIVAQTNVGGTESTRSIEFLLPIAKADIGDQAEPPAGEFSPFGESSFCNDTK